MHNVVEARKDNRSCRALIAVISPILMISDKFSASSSAGLESMETQPSRLFFGVGLVGWPSRRADPGTRGSFLARQRQVNL